LKSLFTENREDFEKKWNDIKIVLEYGMLSEDKFYEKSFVYILQLTTSFIHLRKRQENLQSIKLTTSSVI
jgi:molecular chaperone HtpG